MENDMCEIRSAMYEGFCIYNALKNMILVIEGERVSQEDKKVLSLYLGIMNSVNSISSKINETELKMNMKINYKNIGKEEYYNFYNGSFKNILSDVNFNSITEYLNSLLFKDIVIKFNREYTKYINSSEKNIKNGNKQLVKK